MPKHYKEMMDEIINKMEEDAPANSVAGGGVDLATNAAVSQSPHMVKRKKNKAMNKKKLKIKLRRWYKTMKIIIMLSLNKY